MYYCASEQNVHEDIRNSGRYHLIKGNLCSYDLIINILNIYKIDTVIHFAAQSHVQNSFDNALQYTHDNVVGTHTLLEACRKYNKITRFIHISTDEVYGESMISENEEKKHEGSVLCPSNPYAASKAAAELIAKSYYHSFKMPIIITRGNNVYGPNQYPEKLIPKFITLLKNNQKCTIHGSGKTVRNFIHVDDVSTAIDTLLFKGVIGQIYNIGTKNEYSVMDIARKLIKAIKESDDVDAHVEYVEDRYFNDLRYSVSNEKLSALGWRETVEFEGGLRRTIQWYLNCPDDYWSKSPNQTRVAERR
jgi:dTDP-glucose 4,6-dehydratase